MEFFATSSYPGKMTLQRAFEEAVFHFIFGTPGLEDKALEKVKEILYFAFNTRC